VATSEPYSVDKLTAEARRLAADYRRATGKTLPLSGEIAVNDAIRLLNLEAPSEPNAGYDALRRTGDAVEYIQIKGRVLFDGGKGSPRIGHLKLEQHWDEILLVLMDEDYEPVEIHGASRSVIETTLAGKLPNKRGAMTVAQFKIVATCLWPAAENREQVAR
jgi:hypothetical protein